MWGNVYVRAVLLVPHPNAVISSPVTNSHQFVMVVVGSMSRRILVVHHKPMG